MFLSAINALTLSPALCAILLKPHHGPRRGPIGMVMRGIDHVRDGYGAVVARLVRISIISLAIVAVSVFGIYRAGQDDADGISARRRPGRLLRRRAIAGRRLGRAHAAGRLAGRENSERRSRRSPIISSIVGLNFIDNYCQPNAAFVIVSLKPFDERTDPDQIRARDHRAARRETRGVHGRAARSRSRRRRSSASAPAAASAMCCSAFGGKRSQGAVAGAARACSSPPIRTRSSRASSAPSRPNNPSIYLDIDRDKAQVLGIEVGDIFQALQTSLGGITSTTSICSAAPGRCRRRPRPPTATSVDDIYRINVRSKAGKMVAAAQPRRDQHRHRPAGADPLQQSPRRHRAGRLRRRASPRARRSTAMETVAAQGAAARLQAANGRISRSRKNARRARPRSCSASRCCSHFSSSSRCTKAGRSPCPCCSR